MSGPCVNELRSLCLLLAPVSGSWSFSSPGAAGSRGWGTPSQAPNSMEQAAILGGLGLPCSPKQALALYQHLFRCPAGLDQLRAALQQVRATGHCL